MSSAAALTARKRVVGLAAALFWLGSLLGCTTIYEGKYDWRDGWREARVVMVAGAKEIRYQRFSDCRLSVSPEELTRSRFAVLLYEHVGQARHRVVPLQTGDALAAGDFVYMNLKSCYTPLARRKLKSGRP